MLPAMSSEHLNHTKWTGRVGSSRRFAVLLPCLIDKRCGGSNFKLGRLNSPGSGCLTPTYKHNAIPFLSPESKRIFSRAIRNPFPPENLILHGNPIALCRSVVNKHRQDVFKSAKFVSGTHLLRSRVSSCHHYLFKPAHAERLR